MSQSLLEQDSQAFIYILAMDTDTYQILARYNLPNTQIIALSEFELKNKELIHIKSSRTLGEYCWTITPSLILYCIEEYSLPQVCYVDADLYFYHNPNVLLQEAGSKTVLLSPHRYSLKYDQSQTSGIYCVQFMNFVHHPDGLEALIWWRNACIEWCYNRIEPGRFGDQKYLDDWPTRFNSTHVLEHLGGGMAPWNVQQYELIDYVNKNKLNFKILNSSSGIFDLIFYHFHGVKIYSNGQVDFGGYYLKSEIKNKIYNPYARKILNLDVELLKNKLITQEVYLTKICDQERITLKQMIQHIRAKISKTYNRISSYKLFELT